MIGKIKVLIKWISLLSFVAFTQISGSQSNNFNNLIVAKNKKQKRSSGVTKRKRQPVAQDELVKALQLVKLGNFKEASTKLFQLSHSPKYSSRKMQIKYLLGLMLYQMNLPQVSAFQFISVVKSKDDKFLRQSIEKLSLAADYLGDDTLLNYALSKVNVNDFPRVHRDMLYYRIGEYQMRNLQYKEASQSFERVSRSNSLYPRAKYMQGLAFSEVGSLKEAYASFDDLVSTRDSQGVNDPGRVLGLLGKARVLYQGKKWDESIEAYREIPRDSSQWHDTLFESSWAMLRSGRFRSALSNFHSLHSDFYENNYLPESLLLRSIVYLYICKYDEMEKVLNLFVKLYKPVYKDVLEVMKTYKVDDYFEEVVKILSDWKNNSFDQSKYKIPLMIARKVSQEGDYQISYGYIKKLIDELNRIEKMDVSWKNSSLGKYAKRILVKRLAKAKQRAGIQIRKHFDVVRDELLDLFEQEGFIRYEMINGKKEFLKKRIAGKDLPDEQVDEDTERDYYVQNGFEYWPFRGEYWQDELGNYHYVGTQSCN